MTTQIMSKAPSWLWWLLIGLVAAILSAGWIFWPKKETTKTSQSQSAQQATVSQPWQLCWEKKPEHTGKTNTRQHCVPTIIETRTASYIVVSYICSEGLGVMEGTSINGIDYDGLWKDSTGWGKWHLKFVSADTAFGWSDDEGKKEKAPNVLTRFKGGPLM